MPLMNRPAAAMVMAAAGYGLTFGAWTLCLSPVQRADLGEGPRLLMAAAAVLVGSAGRIPAGVLTDRYGARAVLPMVSAAAALPVLGLGTVGSVAGLVAVAGATGIAGTTFAVGSALIIRSYPAGWRGFALSVFGGAIGLAAGGGPVA